MGDQHKQATNEPSFLLSDEENEMVFAALGAQRITKATAVAQVYHAHPDPSRWTKYKTGVVCLVKDNLRKSYYIRLLEMNAKRFSIAWEQELYNQFTYKKDFPRFHHFPGDNFMVGLNFSDEREADKFLKTMETKIKDHQQRRQTLKQTWKGKTFIRAGPSLPLGHLAPPLPSTTNPTPPHSSPFRMIPKPSPNINTTPSSNTVHKGGKRNKINKSDINGPSIFQHLAHVGWDLSTGAFDSSNIDAAWKKLFDTIGVSDSDLKDVNTAKFIYGFVEQHGGIEKANQQLEVERQKAPPPPPSRGGHCDTGSAPPPLPPHSCRAPSPPTRNAPPPTPAHYQGPPPLSHTAPPPSPSRHGGGGKVSAPPPPSPINVPALPVPLPVSTGGPLQQQQQQQAYSIPPTVPGAADTLTTLHPSVQQLYVHQLVGKNKDIHGYLRGGCTNSGCNCVQYSYIVEQGLKCSVCRHVPMQHTRLILKSTAPCEFVEDEHKFQPRDGYASQQQLAFTSNLHTATDAIPQPSVKQPSVQQICKFFEYHKLVYMEPSGKVPEFCGRKHALDFNSKGSRVSHINTCLLRGCNKPKHYDSANNRYFDYCGQSHAKEAKKNLIKKASAQEFQMILAHFTQRWHSRKGTCGELYQVFVIDNPKLKDRFKKYQSTLSNSTVCSDPTCGICGISQKGMSSDLKASNIAFQRFGSGFYLAPNSSKSHDYTRGHDNYRAMLLFDVAEGYKYIVQSNQTTLTAPPPGYDSVYGQSGGSLKYDEIVLYESEALLPTHIVIYIKEGIFKIAQ